MRQHDGRDLRTDIQGLRAIAVAMVVVYHLDERLLPGGYVGVDVFLVISGFLITTHLLGRPPASAGDLVAFWGRRIRRLLPASLLVLGCTLIAVRLVAPETQWEANARDIRAAALYVVNWSLAERAVDYLAVDNVPTAVQHFWSLSVEEQFYFGWPILIGLVLLLARWLRLPPTASLSVALCGVVALSFGYSVTQTASDPAAAYFITPTRIWELGAGGVLALVVDRMTGRHQGLPPIVRQVGSWLGLAAVAATGVLYSSATPFPGYQASLPILGTLLVILCAPVAGDPGTPGRLLAHRPVQWLGNVSYSVYLWHWPLIILVPFAIDRELRAFDLLGVLAATLVLAALTERYVERPFRARRLVSFPKGTLVAAGAAMSVVVVAATVQVQVVRQLDQEARTELAQAIREGGPCFGAAALEQGHDCAPATYDELVPSTSLAPKDKSRAYAGVDGKECWSSTPTFPTYTCDFGQPGSDVTIALVGNSHAGHWLPTLEVLAQQHHWHIQTHVASRCASSDIRQRFDTAEQSEACQDWVRSTTEQIAADPPDLVVMSNRVSVGAVGHDLEGSQSVYAEGYADVLDTLLEAGVPVLAIRDTPAPAFPVPTCIADHADGWTECDGTREEWLPADPVVGAIRSRDDDRARVADLTDHLCEGPTCRAVNGSVITYFDGTHLTATYARTLAPYLEPHVRELLT